MTLRLGCSSTLLFLLLALAPYLQAQASQPSDTATNHLQQANEALTTQVAADPKNLSAWQQLGEVQLAQSLNEDAMGSFETVLKTEPESSPAQAGEVRAAIAAALADRAAGNSDRGLACLLRARRYVPNSPELLIAFGIQADSMQIYKDADEALSVALRLEPQSERALYALAHVELDEQKTDKAEEHLRAYLKIRPEDATAHYGLGHLLHMMAKDEQAKLELDRSIALQPHQTESYYELGQIALELSDDAGAKDAYTRVLTSAPNHGGALAGMGMLAFRAKDYAAAEKYLRQAVLYAPDDITAHRYYGMTLARLGQAEQSRQESDLAQRLTEQQNKLRHGYTLTPTP